MELKMKRLTKRLLKLLLGSAAALVALLLIAAVAAWLFFPRERAKTAVVRELSNRLNQDVSVEEVSLGFYPDAELVAKGVRVKERESGVELISIERIYLDISILQLLKRKMALEDIVITSPELHLVREREGIWNTQRAFKQMRGDREQKERSESFSISPIRIRHGTIQLYDETSAVHYEVKNISAIYNLSERTLQIDSADVSLPFLNAQISGTISALATPEPRINLTAGATLINEGPLGWLKFPDAAPPQPVAELHVQTSGKSRDFLVNAAFTINPALMNGVKGSGTLQGRLQTREGAFDVSALDASIGKSVLSLSGEARRLWSDERDVRLSGKGTFAIREFLKAIRQNPDSALDPEGTVSAILNVQGSRKQIKVQSDMNLLNAGLTIPRLMRKEPGAPATLAVDAVFTPPNGLVIEDFSFIVEQGKVEGRAEISSSSDPWFNASLKTVNFPLKKLDLVPAIAIEEGNLILDAVVSKNSPSSKRMIFAGRGTVEKVQISTKYLNEPVRNLYASFTVNDKTASVEAASFSLGTSLYHAKAQAEDVTHPHIVGSLQTQIANINEVAGLIKKSPEQASSNTSTPSSMARDFSLELLIEADSLYAGSTMTGPVTATWTYANNVHSFDPVTLSTYGGTVQGNFHLDTSGDTPTWKTHFDGRQMKLEEIVAQFRPEKTKVTGALDMAGDLSGIAKGEKGAILGSIDGKVNVNASDGEIRQYTMLKNIFLLMQAPLGTLLIPGVREAVLANTVVDVIATGGRSLDPTNISYSKLAGEWSLSEGVAHSDEFRLETGVAHLMFKGDINLPANSMDMTVRATPLGTLGSLMGKIPIAGNGLQKAKETILSTDFLVRGPLSDPSVTFAAAEKLMGKNGE